MVTIIPSILAATPRQLGLALEKYRNATKTLHLDVVDGKFAISRSLHFKLKLPKLFKYNAHLMIQHPERWIKQYGHLVDLCIVQASTIKNKAQFIAWMKKRGKKVAFALKPEEKISVLKPYLKQVDWVLVLTVHPGRYGAKYLPAPLKKIKLLKTINPKLKIMVDGGMNPVTIRDAVKAGADLIVCGSYLAESKQPEQDLLRLKSLMFNWILT